MKAETLNIKLALITLVVLSFSGGRPTFAQSTAFTYQGRLQVDANPASGSYDLRFALYDALAGGHAIGGALTNAATGVSDGLFTVTLDFGSAFNGMNYWLEIAARTNGNGAFSTLSPRQPILAAPQALYAASAGSATTATTAGTANSVSAANLTGTLADSQLSSNIVRLNIPNTTTRATGGVVVTSGFITGAYVTSGGSGYTVAPTVTVVDVSGSNAVMTATVSGGAVVNLIVQNAGRQYSAGATLTIAPPPSNAYQTFNSGNVFNGVNTFGNGSNVFVGTFDGTFGSLSGRTITVSNNLNLPATTATSGIIYSGGNTFVHAFGTNNFFAGPGAGNLNLSDATGSVGVGINALHGLTTGIGNTAEGAFALMNNMSGGYNTANGNQTMVANRTGSANTATGWGALNRNTADNNTADGMQALRFNTSGNNNTASGWDALLENTTGSRNSAHGALALWNNLTGGDNTASGYNAMANNTIGTQNTANGAGALQSNTNGNFNTANGYQALNANTSGNYNTANGIAALKANTTGSENTGSGDYALALNTTGSQNSANGSGSLQNNTTGSQNAASGYKALENNGTGSFNTADGYQALYSITTGSNNIGLGYQAGYNLTTGSSNIAIGNLGLAGESRTIRIGTTGIHANTFLAGVIIGNGAGLSSLNASQLASGTVADARLSPNVALLAANQAFSGANTFNNGGNRFAGDGTGLTNLSANAITGGLTTNLAVLVPGGGTNTLYFTNGVLRAIQ